jgi:Tol biopolymer transport system component
MRLLRLAVLVLLNAGLVVGAVGVGAQTAAHQLAYVARVNRNQEIFLLDVHSRLTYNLTQNPGDDTRPVWSPDGSKIAFESWRGGVRAVFVMDADGRQVRRLSADGGASEYAPEWLPDSQSLIFRSIYRPFGGSQPSVLTYRVNADGSHLQRVDEILRPPSDRTISQRWVNGSWGIYVTEGDVTRKLADIERVVPETPRWSLDGSLIAYLAEDESGRTEIYVMNTDGSNLRQMTYDRAAKTGLSWRP